jgi:hypothetical protein
MQSTREQELRKAIDWAWEAYQHCQPEDRHVAKQRCLALLRQYAHVGTPDKSSDLHGSNIMHSSNKGDHNHQLTSPPEGARLASQMRRAREAYERAKFDFELALQLAEELGLRNPDGTHNLNSVTRTYNLALQQYSAP